MVYCIILYGTILYYIILFYIILYCILVVSRGIIRHGCGVDPRSRGRRIFQPPDGLVMQNPFSSSLCLCFSPFNCFFVICAAFVFCRGEMFLITNFDRVPRLPVHFAALLLPVGKWGGVVLVRRDWCYTFHPELLAPFSATYYGSSVLPLDAGLCRFNLFPPLDGRFFESGPVGRLCGPVGRLLLASEETGRVVIRIATFVAWFVTSSPRLLHLPAPSGRPFLVHCFLSLL